MKEVGLGQIIEWSVQDFSSPPVLRRIGIAIFAAAFLTFSLGAFIINLLFGMEFSLFGAEYEVDTLIETSTNYLAAIPLIGGILSGAVTLLLSGFLVVIGSYFTLILGLFIVSFLSGGIIHSVLSRRYGHAVSLSGHGNILTSLTALFVTILWHMLFFLLAMPFLFIPGIGFLLLYGILYSLFRSFLMADVGSIIFSSREAHKKATGFFNIELALLSLLAYGLTLLPYIGMVAPIFAVILLTNYFYARGEIEALPK